MGAERQRQISFFELKKVYDIVQFYGGSGKQIKNLIQKIAFINTSVGSWDRKDVLHCLPARSLPFSKRLHPRPVASVGFMIHHRHKFCGNSWHLKNCYVMLYSILI